MKLTSQTPNLGIGWSEAYGQPPAESSFEGTPEEIDKAREEARSACRYLSEHLFVGQKRVIYPSLGQVLWSLQQDGEIEVRLEGEPAVMSTLYTSHEQCLYFSVPYYGAGQFTVMADTLLQSKPGGYDSQHTDFLTSLGSERLSLKRDDPDTIGPGWWHITRSDS